MEYEIRVNKRFGEQRELGFVTPPNVVLPPPLADVVKQRDLFTALEEQKNEEAAN
jgi:hypothetical protein